MLTTHLPSTLAAAFPRLSHAPAQSQSASFETLQANPYLKSHPAGLWHFQNLNFSEREASTISGVERGPQQKSVKPTSHTAPLLYCYMRLLIPLPHGFPSPFQALIHNKSASHPKSQRFHTIPHDHRESLTAQVGCDQHAKEKTYTALLLSCYLPTPPICKG